MAKLLPEMVLKEQTGIIQTISILSFEPIGLDDCAAQHDGGRAFAAGCTQRTCVHVRGHSERTPSVLQHLLLVRGELTIRGRCTHCVLDTIQDLVKQKTKVVIVIIFVGTHKHFPYCMQCLCLIKINILF